MSLDQILKDLGVLKPGPFHLKNAGSSDFYADIKKAYGYPHALNAIADAIWNMIYHNVTCIAAEGYGGISPASVISGRYDVNLALVRPEPKGRGTGSCIDGYVPCKDDRVAVMDDVFTTGGSLLDIMRALEPTGAWIAGCYVVVKRGEGDIGVPVHYLLKAKDLI